MAASTSRKFTLASRGSDLAKVQTHAVRDTLHKQFPSTTFSTSFITTDGDRNQSQALYLIGGKSLWTKDLEVALVEGAVDMLVHCYKDVPTTLPEGLEIAGVLEREDPVDALVVKKGLVYKTLEDLPEGSVVGTSSVRRVAQLKRRFPKLAFRDVRGNVDTRIAKLDAPDSPFTAIVLAKAGLVRLGLDARISSDLPPPTLYYAVSQAALAIEIRANDDEARRFCRALTHWQTEWRCAAERACLRVLEGGCSVPVGTHTEIVEKGEGVAIVLKITGCVTSLTGAEHVQHSLEEGVRSVEDAEAVGAKLARILIDTGAKAILEDLTQDRDKRIGEVKTAEEKQRVEAAIAA